MNIFFETCEEKAKAAMRGASLTTKRNVGEQHFNIWTKGRIKPPTSGLRDYLSSPEPWLPPFVLIPSS